MIISSRAWHMRLCRFWAKEYMPVSLCLHFGSVVIALNLSFWGIVFSPAIGLLWLTTRVYRRWASDPKAWIIDHDARPLSILLGMGFPLTLLFLTVGITVDILRRRAVRRGKLTPPKPEEPSLAKRRKVCPLITVKED